MSGYDKIVVPLERNEIEVKACAWRSYFGIADAWVVDVPHVLEIEIPRILPRFALRILPLNEMAEEEARTHHAVPAIDLREDVYERLCSSDGRARFTGAHELGHLFLHSGESRPRAVSPIKSNTISRRMSSERQADDFAASFLMPAHLVRQFNCPTELVRMRELLLWPKGRPPVPEVEEFLRKMKGGNGHK